MNKGLVKSTAINLGLMGLGIVIALFIAEMALRIAEKLSTPSDQGESPYVSHGYYYTYHPNTTFEWKNEAGENISVMTDQFGLRNTVADYRHSQTLLVLGDSFVEAANTSDAKMFTTILEEDLVRKTGLDLAVINAGIGGYSNSHSLFLLNQIWPEIKPDWIILAVYLGNDLRDNCYTLSDDARLELGRITSGSTEEAVASQTADNPESVLYCPATTNPPAVPYGVWHVIQYSKVLSLLYNFFAKSEGRTDDWLSYYMFELETYRNVPAAPVAAAVENTRYILQQMSNICRNYGIACLVVGLPSKAEVYEEFSFVAQSETTPGGKERALDILRDENGFSFDNPSRYYAQICAEFNLPYFDLTPIFRQYPSNEIFYKIDRHWNATAQEFAAKYLGDLLIDAGLFRP